MAQVRVMLFASARELLGQEAVEVEVPGPVSAAQLKQLLLQQYPALAPVVPAAQLAVGQEFASSDQQVRPQDEVALIPPVSGG